MSCEYLGTMDRTEFERVAEWRCPQGRLVSRGEEAGDETAHSEEKNWANSGDRCTEGPQVAQRRRSRK